MRKKLEATWTSEGERDDEEEEIEVSELQESTGMRIGSFGLSALRTNGRRERR